MRTIIIIPSRMASTRFPGKPMEKINGIPMIQRVWEQAMKSKIGEVYVACAEKKIHDFILGLGGKSILTDPNIQSGTDRVYYACEKIKNIKNLECVINLQGDMPLINPNHIKKVLDPIKNNFLIGTLATNLKKKEFLNPNITKVKVKLNSKKFGKAEKFFRTNPLLKTNIYHHVGIYSYVPYFLKKFVELPKSKNEASLKLEQCRAMDAKIDIGVTYIPQIPISVDTKEDLITAEHIIKSKNRND